MERATFRYDGADLATRWGKEILTVRHNLEHHPLFTDDALAELVEKNPQAIREVSTMDPTREDTATWKRVAFDDMNGREILQCVRDGLLWINIGDVGDVEPAYQELIDELLETTQAQVPGLKTFKRRIGVLVSSPGARVYYHCDIPGQGLLQVRGEKTIWIYPANDRLLPAEALERVVLGATTEEIPYDSSFDEFATRLDFAPGIGALWPLNWPHRVINGPMMNVSVTIEYWNDDARRHYAMNLANGVMRQVLHRTPRSRDTTGLRFWSKAALAAAWKFSGAANRYRRTYKTDLTIGRNSREKQQQVTKIAAE